MSENAKPEAQPDNRRRTYLLEPYLQIKLGLYNMILSFAFAAALLGVLHAEWVRFRSWLRFTEIAPMIDSQVASYAQTFLFWVLLILVIFLVASTWISVLMTHRLIGPSVAFKRQIQSLIDGDYDARCTLREHDAFTDVASELNRLAEALAANGKKDDA